ncbi:MAG: hypothetical protein Q6L68_13160 [Thermostichus sp. DG02_5_bins_236]
MNRMLDQELPQSHILYEAEEAAWHLPTVPRLAWTLPLAQGKIST